MRSSLLVSLGLGSFLALSTTLGAAATTERPVVAGNYALYLDGAAVGPFARLEGGGATGTIVTENVMTGHFKKKHFAGAIFEDITLDVNVPPPALANWVKAAVNTTTSARKSGVVATLDAQGKELSRTTWTGFVGGLATPAFEAASHEPVFLSVSIVPETATLSPGGQVPRFAPMPSRAASQALASNFRLTIPGIDTSHVVHVDPVTLHYAVTTTSVGVQRTVQKTPGDMEVGDLVFTIPETAAASVYAWYDGFARGAATDDKEKVVTLEALGPDMKAVLYRLTLKGVGIKGVAPAASTDSVRRLRVDCYVEAADIDFVAAP